MRIGLPSTVLIGTRYGRRIGGADPAIIALGLVGDVKLWALIKTNKISSSKQTLTGIQASFEV